MENHVFGGDSSVRDFGAAPVVAPVPASGQATPPRVFEPTFAPHVAGSTTSTITEIKDCFVMWGRRPMDLGQYRSSNTMSLSVSDGNFVYARLSHVFSSNNTSYQLDFGTTSSLSSLAESDTYTYIPLYKVDHGAIKLDFRGMVTIPVFN